MKYGKIEGFKKYLNVLIFFINVRMSNVLKYLRNMMVYFLNVKYLSTRHELKNAKKTEVDTEKG